MKDYTRALADIDTAIRLQSDIPIAYLARGMAKHALKNSKGAIEDMDKAVRLNFFFTDAYVRRGGIKYDTADYQGALEDFNQALKIDSDDPVVYYQRAMTYLKMEKTDDALNDLSKVLSFDPYNALTMYNRAILYSEKGDMEAALKDYDRVVELNPNNILAAFNRGVTKHQLKDYKGAVADYSRAIELFPDFSKAYANRSDARRQLGDEKGSLDDRNKAVLIEETIAKSDDSTFKKYADSAFLSKTIEFEADFQNVSAVDGKIQYQPVYVDLEQNFFVTYFYNDSVYVEQKRSEYWLKKVADINKTVDYKLRFGLTNRDNTLTSDEIAKYLNNLDSTLKISPSDPVGHFFTGILNGMVKNYNSALKAYDLAIQINPKFTLAYFNRANIKLEMAQQLRSNETGLGNISIGNSTQMVKSTPDPDLPDYKDALEDYDKALKLNPDLSFAWFNRGNVKAKMADYEGALSDYTKAIDLEDKLAQAYYNRALIRVYLKMNDLACQDFSKAGELGLKNAYNLIKRYCGNP
jgi:tetratricopeptide (TPR) repeat protein